MFKFGFKIDDSNETAANDVDGVGNVLECLKYFSFRSFIPILLVIYGCS